MYDLSNGNIEKLICELDSLLESARVSAQGCTKVRLMAEEILLKYQEHFGSSPEVSLSNTKHIGKITVTLKINCESFDPISTSSEDDVLLQNLLQSLGYVPTWRYKNKCNELSFLIRCKNRIPDWAGTLIACALGAVFGLAARQLPADTLSVLTDTLFAPVFSAIMGFLGAVSTMLIFLSIMNGIVGMENVATLNRIGKKLMGKILITMFVLGVIIVIVFGLLFRVSGSVGNGFDFGTLWSMVLGIIPSSFIDPFNGGNALQILFLSFVIGFIILRSVSVFAPVVDVMQGLYQIIQEMMVLVLKALPLVVFISLFNLFSGSTDIDVKAIYKFPLLHLVFTVACLAAVILGICAKQKMRLSVLMKKLLPTFLVALSTASSNATLSDSMEICEKKLGIDPKLVKVGIPLAYSIDKPASIIFIIAGVMCMAQMFLVDISWTTLISITFTALLLSIAAPAVPGAGISVMTLMFTVYGIPLEALSIIISLDVISDRIVTPSNVINAQLDLIQVADSLGDLDRDVLRNPDH